MIPRDGDRGSGAERRRAIGRLLPRAALSATIWTLVGAIALLAQDFPRPVGYVNDFAQVISDEWENKITAICSELERKTSAEIAVVTMPTVGENDYREYANRLFEAWGIGKKGKDNGVLIFNAVQERKVWIEVGYGLEPVINDARAGDIFREVMRPLLREGRYGEAFYNGVLSIAEIIAKAEGVELEPHEKVGGGAGSPPQNVVPFLETLAVLMILVFLGLGLGSRRRRLVAGPWWWGWGSGGGFGGGFGGGGFGGGFGGFGGGASGGGGAGGGY
ncbi:MAG: TPM domain-containing protein [candidate division KSB1 bacterium]|nr:TPM domain-containing protein [candidate division KSB1 bacterium]